MKCEYCNDEYNGKYASGRFCDISCARGFSTKNNKIKRNNKISKTLTGRQGKKWTKEQHKKYSKSRTMERVITPCKECNKNIIHIITEKRKYHAECWLNNVGGFNANSTIKHKSIYNGFKMDSGSEKEFAILLDKHNIEWIKNQGETWFRYSDIKGKTRKYYPDFYLPKYDWWIEIKGKYYETENDVLKLESVGNIELMYHNELRLPSVI